MIPLSSTVLPLAARPAPRQRNGRVPRRLSLRSGESVVTVVHPSRAFSLPKYAATLGLYGIWRKRHTYVVTNQRLMIGKGVVTRREWTIPFRKVEGVSFVRRGPGAYAEVQAISRGRREIDAVGPLSARDARRVVSAIEDRM